MKKVLCIVMVLGMVLLLAACGEFEASGTSADVNKTQQVASNLAQNQPAPSDIDYAVQNEISMTGTRVRELSVTEIYISDEGHYNYHIPIIHCPYCGAKLKAYDGAPKEG